MNRAHPRLAGAMAVMTLFSATGFAAARLGPRAPAFDPLSGPSARLPIWRVDVDVAPVGEIEALPGVGPRLAERIVRDRAAHGPFGGAQGLDRVAGVGPALIERINAFVR